MALLFEISFYVGMILVGLAALLLLKVLFQRQVRKAVFPLGLFVLGGTLVIGPAIVSRNMAVDLGPREKIVNNERHITLTGWDGDDYSMLREKLDTVVLQMANGDVTDATLDYLAPMKNLRELDLNDSAVGDEGLKTLSQLSSLETLRLRGTSISDAGFQQHLLGMAGLKRLD